MKRHIPNLLTCCNLFCGCIGIIFTFQGLPELGAAMIYLAAIFDFFDGFAARMLRASSPIGRDLDSLADCVTFGVLPGLIVFHLMSISPGLHTVLSSHSLSYLSIFIPVFSALRLAKFNNDPRQTDEFIGVNTPTNAMLIASFPFIISQQPNLSSILMNPYFLIPFTLVMCFLLVSEIRLFSLKFKSFSFAHNKIVYIFLILSLILLIFLKFLAIPFIFILYIISSLIKNREDKNKEAKIIL